MGIPVLQDKNVANVKNPYSPTFELEGVRFEFDAEKLAGKTYKYFDVASKTFKDGAVTLSTDNTKLYIAGELAATIDNYKDNLCTVVDNPLKGHKTYNIKLQEADPDAASNFGKDTKPTEAAKALVGQIVPIKLVADLCYGDATPGHPAAHTEVIKAYDANIIEPMTITVNKEEGEVTDAVVNGSSVDVTVLILTLAGMQTKTVISTLLLKLPMQQLCKKNCSNSTNVLRATG